jgi:hypothetical protein
MFVPVLRGRAAVTLGHDTSLLGPDGLVTLLVARSRGRPPEMPGTGCGRGDLRRPLMTSIGHDSVAVTFNLSSEESDLESRTVAFGSSRAVVQGSCRGTAEGNTWAVREPYLSGYLARASKLGRLPSGTDGRGQVLALVAIKPRS